MRLAIAVRALAREVAVESRRSEPHNVLLVVAALLWAGGAGVLAWSIAGEDGDSIALDRVIVAVGLLAGAWIVASIAAIVPRRGEIAPPAAAQSTSERARPEPVRVRQTLARHVPETVVDEHLGDAIDDVDLAGERADLSVLFCDIRGFTSWSQDKGASEVIAELNLLLGELSASVTSTGGTLDKFTGDGLMAFWGAPVAMADHANRAVRAALDMLERLDRVNDRRSDDGQGPFAIGVAVHSGVAVVGGVGNERRLDYTAIGDTVNVAARLEASARDQDAPLIVSSATVDLLDGELRDAATLVDQLDAWALQ